MGDLRVLILEVAGNVVMGDCPRFPVTIVKMGKLMDQFGRKLIIIPATSPNGGLEGLSEVYSIPVPIPGGGFSLSILLEFWIIEEPVQSFKPEPNGILLHVYTPVTAIRTNTLKQTAKVTPHLLGLTRGQ